MPLKWLFFGLVCVLKIARWMAATQLSIGRACGLFSRGFKDGEDGRWGVALSQDRCRSGCNSWCDLTETPALAPDGCGAGLTVSQVTTRKVAPAKAVYAVQVHLEGTGQKTGVNSQIVDAESPTENILALIT
jgi:hypothetical protein